MNKIEYINLLEEKIPSLKTIKKVINFAISYEKLDNLEFNIIFVDNNYIHNLNKTYRSIDRPTDVITFALEDAPSNIPMETRLLGDIYISVDKAKEQSIEYNHSLERELAFLALHGFLHLLGYDHMNLEDEKIMFKKQDDILNALEIRR